jgi:hypothetical protein
MQNKIINTKNSKEFWNAVKFYKRKPIISNSISPEVWVDFLLNKYASESVPPPIFLDASHPTLDREIDVIELNYVLDSLRSKKAPGTDKITNEFYKALPNEWRSYLLDLLNKILKTQTIPTEWSKILIFVLHKKGDPSVPSNYRIIALINTIVKILTRILEIRLSKWAEDSSILPEGQCGFRKGRGCIDNIFVLYSVLFQQVEMRHKTVYALFVDFEAAFDGVPHYDLWYKLGKIGVSSTIIRFLSKLYSKAELFLMNNLIPVGRGVLQGDSISPLLFSLYIADIEAFFRDNGFSGISINDTADILILLYADDIVILADSPSDMRKKIECLENYCNTVKLKVNISKTKVLPFHKGRLRKSRPFHYKGEEIKICKSYTYLGVEFSSSSRFNVHCASTVTKTKCVSEAVINVLRSSRSDTWESKIKLFETVVLPTATYGAEVWGLSCTEHVEKVQLHYFKRLLLLNNRVSNWALRLETGRIKLENLIFFKSLELFIKILAMPEHRYPKICLKKLMLLSSSRNQLYENRNTQNWVGLLQKQFSLASVTIDWENFENLLTILGEIKWDIAFKHSTALYAADIQQAVHSISCPGYQIINPNFVLGEQFGLKSVFPWARCITQLRLASEYGLYIYLKDKGIYIACNEHCPICNMREEETSTHILVRCPMYSDLRHQFLSKYIYNIVNYDDKVMVLLSHLSVNKMKDVYKFMMNALNVRTYILETTG